MIAAFDTHYSDTMATTCAVLFDWKDSVPRHTFFQTQESTEPYIPGQFYRKELPCILSTLKQMQGYRVDLIIVDSYVILDDSGAPGLGAHVYNATGQTIPVVGVAKNPFTGVDKLHRKVHRGRSQNPLYVSAIGYDLSLAALNVAGMHGPNRLPTILKLVDQYCRNPCMSPQNLCTTPHVP